MSIELTNFVAKPTLKSIERWNVANEYFQRRCREIGAVRYVDRFFPEVPEKKVWLFSILIEDKWDDDRWFLLSNTADHDDNKKGYLRGFDTAGSFGGFLADRGMDDTPSLELGLSWHDQGLFSAFEVYTAWIIERKSRSAIEKQIQDLRFHFDIPG